MAGSDLALKTVAELSLLFQAGEVSPVEVVGSLLERVERLDGKLNHYISVLREEALEAARQAEREMASGNYRGPLHGIPIVLKDIIWTKGIRTTCASKVMEHHVPDYDATVVSRLKEGGALILGKMNAQEFAMGGTGTVSYFGPAHNPWNTERITGGSSSGSGGSVAASTSIAAIGTDTGGSVRIPAALCGIVAHKPTYGLVSRVGIMPLAYTADHAGPMTRTVEDAAILLQAMADYDPADPSSVEAAVPDFRASLQGDIKGLRMATIREVNEMPHHPEVEEAFNKAVAVLEEMGASITEVSIPTLFHVRKLHPVISISESSTAHGNMYLEHRDEYGAEGKRRLDLALLLTPADYLVAQRARALLRQEVLQALRGVDFLLSPTVPVPAPEIARDAMVINGREEKVWGWLANYTCPFNDSGHPAASVPCGLSGDGLPIGLQIVGKAFQDAAVLRVAHAYEQATDWHTMRPPLE